MESEDNFPNLSFSDRSDSESTHSTPEEDRIKRLFFTCDTNGDGFITYDDIRQVCIQLDMEYCVDEIMQQLGTDAKGRISYSDFVKRRSELLNLSSVKSDTSEDCESSNSESKEALIDETSLESSFEMYSNPSSSLNDEQAFGSHQNHKSMLCSENSNKLDWAENLAINGTEGSDLSHTNSSVQHDSWEFDSGTHDLEIDTISLHKQIEASGIQMPSNINELLDLANKYYIESINSIKEEKIQIHNQLKSILNERELLQKQIICLKDEKHFIVKELEKKKLKERQKYENKITELQSMIAELSQNLNYCQFLTIKEEDEHNSDENNLGNNEGPNLNEISNGLIDSQISENSKEDHLNSSVNISNKNLKLSFKLRKEQQMGNNFDKFNAQTLNPESHFNGKELDSNATALEIDRLKCRINNLESQLDLSAIHLNESKENAERLTVLLGKYDANNTALQLALNFSDKALEVNELIERLLETEIGLVLANCRAAGLGKLTKMSEKEEQQEIVMIYERANHNRKDAEELAFNYLLNNDRDFGETLGEKTEFSREHQINLKHILNKYKHEKAIIEKSVSQIEPFIMDLDKHKKSTNIIKTNPVLNVENLVLMQDYMAMKEQNASLRSNLYSSRKEISNLKQQIMKMQEICRNQLEFDEIHQKKIKQNIISEQFVSDLKKENSISLEELKRFKKKYSIKVKKLEQRNASNQQRSRAHVKMLQNRISLLESNQTLRKCIETTI